MIRIMIQLYLTLKGMMIPASKGCDTKVVVMGSQFKQISLVAVLEF
jgi:hypothetical protein